jgi:GntR family transcriptional regulator, transcriptional repressor for pyruvate dehydrogenase complex
VPASGLAAVRRTDEHLAALRAALFDPDTADLETMCGAWRAFHASVAVATGNPLFELITRPLYAVLDERDWLGRAAPGFRHRIDADHRRILAAIAAGDPEAARSAARAHLTRLCQPGDT